MDVCVDRSDFKFIQNDPVTRERNELQMAVNELQALFHMLLMFSEEMIE